MGPEYEIATGRWMPVRVMLSTYTIDLVHNVSKLISLRTLKKGFVL